MTLTHTARIIPASIAALALLTGRGLAQDRRAENRAAQPAAEPPAKTRTTPVTTKVLGDYRLEAGDKLRIEVYKDAQLSQSVQVRPDGKISMPLIGDINANGSTPTELREAVTTALKQYLNNPVVSVVVVEATLPNVYVVGEVNHPGAVPVKGEMTVLHAIALAGGLKDFANSKQIRVLRNGPTGAQPIPYDYKGALKGTADQFYLRPGDTVVVPE